jgi:23S rRNA pseudoU1915 N3-methylase RlmH
MTISMNFTIDADPDRMIIIEKIYGTWNIETAREYHDEFREVAKPLTGGKWAKLIDLIKWKSSYPEMVRVIGEHLRWCKENGMVLSVNIIENRVTINQLKKMFAIGGTAGISRIVRTREEAEKILRENGF